MNRRPSVPALWCGCFAFVGLAGCGLVSGLDSLDVTDASSFDGSGDVQDSSSPDGSDGPMPVEGAATACAFEEDASKCFNACADGGLQNCCVGGGGATCGPAQCLGVPMACTSPADCVASTAPSCCLAEVTEPTPACPIILNRAPPMTQATCTTLAACHDNDGGALRICSVDSDCDQSTKCRAAAFLIEPKARFGICAQF